MANITYVEIDSKLAKAHPEIKELYTTAFPAQERIPFFYLINRCKLPDIKFYAFYDDGNFIGISYLFGRNLKTYIHYLAIAQDMRGSGYGGKILSLIKNLYSKNTVFLSIEEISPKYEDNVVRASRLRFYEKNGFIVNDFNIKEFGMTFHILSANGVATPADYIDTMTLFAARPFTLLCKLNLIKTCL